MVGISAKTSPGPEWVQRKARWRTWLALPVVGMTLFPIQAASSTDEPPARGALHVEAVLQDPGGIADGSSLDLNELRDKPLVLDFWATWCIPCLEGLPLWNQRVAEFGEKAHFVALTDELKPLGGFLAEHFIAGLVGVDRDRSVFNYFGVQGLPHVVLLDTEGNIHGIVKGVPTIEQLEGLTGTEDPSDDDSATKPLAPRRATALLQAEITPHEGGNRGHSLHGSGLFEARGTSLAAATQFAWGEQAKTFEFDSELPSDLYDIRIETRAGLGAVRSHLQTALQNVFGIEVEITEREGDAYLLRGGLPNGPWIHSKGTKGEEALLAGPGGEVFLWRQVPAEHLVLALERRLGAPVINETTLEGLWTAKLPMSREPEVVIQDVLEKWGLELIKVRREIPMAVVRGPTTPSREPDETSPPAVLDGHARMEGGRLTGSIQSRPMPPGDP